MMKKKTKKKFKFNFSSLNFSSWWVILFVLLCGYCYEYGISLRNRKFAMLQQQYLQLQKEKQIALAEYENLQLQMNSQSDPDWIELTLMKELGVVPEGQIKVFFTDKIE